MYNFVPLTCFFVYITFCFVIFNLILTSKSFIKKSVTFISAYGIIDSVIAIESICYAIVDMLNIDVNLIDADAIFWGLFSVRTVSIRFISHYLCKKTTKQEIMLSDNNIFISRLTIKSTRLILFHLNSSFTFHILKLSCVAKWRSSEFDKLSVFHSALLLNITIYVWIRFTTLFI